MEHRGGGECFKNDSENGKLKTVETESQPQKEGWKQIPASFRKMCKLHSNGGNAKILKSWKTQEKNKDRGPIGSPSY